MMDLKKYMDITPEIAEAVAAGKPVVALESTILSHGMPYPQTLIYDFNEISNSQTSLIDT